ncbi:MAG: helix-turn-helix transcriptional regulator [Myxococcales bacterium]|nr:helix-turn-helix transcriptional regulator [Myxococcales bacterium]
MVGADLLADAGSGAELAHLGAEGLATVVALIGAVVFYLHHRAEVAESAGWRARAEELLAATGNRVDDQLVSWGLSPAERDVAVLLLKGLSFKEIASVRDTSERTAREQARAVYKKAGVAGRSELAGWFIDDLLPGGDG